MFDAVQTGVPKVRILITGATGLVGNNCLRQLQDSDHDLHVLVRDEHDERPFADLHAHRHEADLGKPDQIQTAFTKLADLDVIIHAAGDTHIGRKRKPGQWRINVDATETLASVARECGAKFVFVSSVDALPAGAPGQLVHEETTGGAKFPCGYVETKREAEQRIGRLAKAGLDAVIVNPGFMLGPWDWKPSSGKMLLEVATRFTPFGPKGGFSVCDVRDVAAAIGRVATSRVSHQRYILAGNNVRYIDAWRTFAKVSGGSPPICAAGPLMRIIAGRWGDLVTRVSGQEGAINSASVGMSELYHYYDSSRAVRELDYRIRPIEESATDAWNWFKQYGYA